MKTKVLFPVFATALILSMPSCLVPVPAAQEPAVLRINCSDTRTTQDPSDTDNYILSLSSSEGKNVYHGLWGECPREFELSPGSYSISLLSDVFKEPCYDCPQFGDNRSVTLSEGQVSEVVLVVGQLNSGLRLLADERFVARYREGALFLRSVSGTLAYGYGETRTAYFLPGRVSVLLNINGSTSTVYSTDLGAGEIRTLRLGVSENNKPMAAPISGVNISVRLDTTRVWTSEDVDWNGSSNEGGGGEGWPSAVSISTARGMAGSKDIWVSGYIVGGDLTSKTCSFEGPFSSRTNLVLADVATCRDRERCMSVNLASGDIRNALNLMDNPALLGRKIWLRGDIVEAYYRLPGLQNLSDYRL